MQTSEAKHFLEKHRVRIINGVRHVKTLVDFLSQPRDNQQSILTNEMASTICAQQTNEGQMRELYRHLNSTRGFELTLQWLKKNEPDLMEDLEKRKTDSEEPARKRLKCSEKDEDETDSPLRKPSLKTLTFTKLEKWVSEAENSQNLMDELKKKLQTASLEELKEELKKKKLKKSLCFNAADVKKIESNKDLTAFFEKTEGAVFPKCTLEIFFRGRGKLPNNPMPKKSHQSVPDYASLKGTTAEMQGTGSKPNMQSEDQQMKCNPDPKSESTNMPCQEEYSRSDLLKQTPAEFHQSGSRAQMQHEGATPLEKDGMGTQEPGEPSTANALPQTARKSKERQLLYEWAKKKCSSEENVEEGVKKVTDCISFENVVEHSEYPWFIAEDIMIYTDPQTGNRQVIITHDSQEKTSQSKTASKLPKPITFSLEYHLWVCGIKEGLVIMNQEERVIEANSFDKVLQRCERLVLEAFAPALAVFKTIQRQKLLHSLTEHH